MRLILLVILWSAGTLFGQGLNFQDDFSDQDLSDWSGNTEHFRFAEEDANTLLQLFAPEAGISYLSIPSTNVVGYWEFFLRFDGFAPSSSNKTEIYLMSDQADLTSALNGYMLRAGENGSDDVFRLFRVTDGHATEEVLSGTTLISSGGDFRVKVSRTASGQWSLEVGLGYGGPLHSEATGTDDTYKTAAHFGFINYYTSSRTDRFYHDFKIDLPILRVNSLAPTDGTHLELAFNKALQQGSVQLNDFNLLPEDTHPAAIEFISEDTLSLEFSEILAGGPHQLRIHDLIDKGAETTLSDTTISFICYQPHEAGDVILNEFMKDPPESLPEYVEVYNQSSKYLSLKNWKVGDERNQTLLPNQDLLIEPRGYMVITTDTLLLNAYFGYLPAVQAALPALNNGGDQIKLLDPEGHLMDSLLYTSAWGGQKVALERRSSEVPAYYQENWDESSSANFGTPGFTNQVQADTRPPELLLHKVLSADSILLVYDETMDPTYAFNLEYYQLSGEAEVVNITALNGDSLLLNLHPKLSDGVDYSLEVVQQRDLFGNPLGVLSISFIYIRLYAPESNELVINEILFDPRADPYDQIPDQTEYIELWNQSEHALTLEGLYLHDEPDERGSSQAIYPVSTEDKWIPPGSFALIYAEDEANEFLDSRLVAYFEDLQELNVAFTLRVDRSDLGLSLNGDAVYLAIPDGAVLDSVHFDESWHNPNLFNSKGIALERIRPDGPSDDPTNWGSSTHITGGTPGSTNTLYQQAGSLTQNMGISFSPNPFSPDGDGFEDHLLINYKLDEADYLLHVRIFDRYGRQVRELANGKAAGFEGSLIWDGLTDEGHTNRIGIYIVLFKAYNSSKGKITTFKKTVVLARKFN